MNALLRFAVPACLLTTPAVGIAFEGGIPPQVAAKLGIPSDTVKKVQDLAFDANDKLIGLEAELKRAQLALEREIRAESPDESRVEKLLEAVGKAEVAVRKNRLGLMIRVRKILGNDLWLKMEALRGENRTPPPEGGPGGVPGMGMGPPPPPHGTPPPEP